MFLCYYLSNVISRFGALDVYILGRAGRSSGHSHAYIEVARILGSSKVVSDLVLYVQRA